MSEQNLIERCVASLGRCALPEAFFMHIKDLTDTVKVNERLIPLVRDAIETYERLDADRTIPWIKEGSENL